MILEEAYRTHMRDRNLAANTVETNISALRRIESRNDLNIENEFERDKLVSLLQRLTYTREDERMGRANPTNLASEPSRLFITLGWYRSVLDRYRSFRLGDVLTEPAFMEDVVENELEETAGRSFKLEQDLQDALRANIAQLEVGLTVADGGKEYKVDAGYIDILARDKSGNWVVIELKAGDAKPDSIAQVLSYMSCIAEEKREPTRGILIASDFVPRVRWAVRSVPTLALRKYAFSFVFDKI